MGSKVTKRDIFHSEIYYNTSNQRPQRVPAGGGEGLQRLGDSPRHSCVSRADESSEKMDCSFQIFCDLPANLAPCLNLRRGTESWPISYSKQGPKRPKSGPRTAQPGDNAAN